MTDILIYNIYTNLEIISKFVGIIPYNIDIDTKTKGTGVM